MALATQCPFCQTTFRVAQDQLKLRGGLVRCGNCKEVFNGNDHLVTPELAQQLVAAPPAPTTTQTPVSQPPSAWPPLPGTPNAPNPPTPPFTVANPDSATPAIAPEPAPTTPAWLAPANLSATFASIAAETSDAPWGAATERAADSATTTASDTPREAPAPETANINTLTQELSFPVPQTSSAPQIDSSADDSADAAAIDKALNELAADTTTPAPPGLLKQAATPDDAANGAGHEQEEERQEEEQHEEEDEEEAEEEAEFEDDTPSFVQRAERRERLGRVLRVVMLIGIMLLSITLPLQALYLWRNQVATWLPSTRPLLSAVCARLHCAVGLPTNIEQLSLESNELQLLPPNQNIYTLTVLLRNRGAAVQSWPYMELTLNDNDEKAITRRVFTPREYLASVTQVNDGFAGNSEQQVKMTFELSQPVAAGYRVYLFFP